MKKNVIEIKDYIEVVFYKDGKITKTDKFYFLDKNDKYYKIFGINYDDFKEQNEEIRKLINELSLIE